MGERLVIDIKRNNKSIVTAYYHWSAYTAPAIHILHRMYQHVLSNAQEMTDEQLQLAMIRFAENSTGLGFIETAEDRLAMEREFEERMKGAPESMREMMEDLLLSHGGISADDLCVATQKFPGEHFKLDKISRNEGLISISEQSMESCKSWAQGIIDVDLDSGVVLNGIVFDYDEAEYLDETAEEEEYTPPDNLPRSPIDIAKFPLCDVEIVKDVIDITDNGCVRYEDTIYQFIDG